MCFLRISCNELGLASPPRCPWSDVVSPASSPTSLISLEATPLYKQARCSYGKERAKRVLRGGCASTRYCKTKG